jgi:hypothetical protein
MRTRITQSQAFVIANRRVAADAVLQFFLLAVKL